jgi:hypothetical protein
MQQQSERVWHNIRPNEQTRLPRNHIILTTEVRSARRGKIGIQKWRLAVATYIQGAKGRKTKTDSKDYRNLRDLWTDVSRNVGGSGRTVIWAHNLGNAVRVTGMFEELPARGWILTGHNITPRASWLEWKTGKATVLMVDAIAFFNTTIEQIGVWHGLGVRAVDLDSNRELDWFAHCRSTNSILSKAVTEYLGWLEAEDMGNFQITGAAQSWATFRHKFLTHKLTVHNETDILAHERRAMWTGRAEAYWHGELKGERVYEFDFKQAYPRIARDYTLPAKFLGPMPPSYNWRALLGSDRTALLARVRVNTGVPVVPTKRDGRILWAVGQFDTVLWDVEIKAALDAGAEVQVLEGWFYRKAPILHAWGSWIIEQLARPDSEVPAWIKAILKHHSRALIGRFAMTYNLWEEFGEMPTPSVGRQTLHDLQTLETYDLMQVGKTVWRDMGRADWQNSMPMITGYVQAIGRVHLWEVLQLLGERKAVYADTDSILCTGRYVEELAQIAHNYGPAELRLKRAWDGLTIYGPRQIVTGAQVRVSGIPRNAEQMDRRHYEGVVTDSLVSALRTGTLDGIITRDRKWEVKGVDNRRLGTGFGWTEPIRIDTQVGPQTLQDGNQVPALGNAP